jgi:hypothetical protein
MVFRTNVEQLLRRWVSLNDFPYNCGDVASQMGQFVWFFVQLMSYRFANRAVCMIFRIRVCLPLLLYRLIYAFSPKIPSYYAI